MFINDVLDEARGAAQTEPMAFRLPVQDKARLLDICEAEGLSVGKLMRKLVNDFIREYEASK